MSKKETRRVDEKETPSVERELYPQVERFFFENKGCIKTGSAAASSISLNLFGGTIYPDVYGVKKPKDPEFEVYMAEGKRDFGGRNF